MKVPKRRLYTRGPIRLVAVWGFFLLTVTTCVWAQEMVEVGYIFHESTEWTQFIWQSSQEIPIKFDAQSNQEALLSLFQLKPSILYANSDGSQIVLFGQHDSSSRIFTLEKWYIYAPFKEYKVVDETILPHQFVVVERASLEKDDFVKTEKFDPYQESFDPHLYMKKKEEKKPTSSSQ